VLKNILLWYKSRHLQAGKTIHVMQFKNNSFKKQAISTYREVSVVFIYCRGSYVYKNQQKQQIVLIWECIYEQDNVPIKRIGHMD